MDYEKAYKEAFERAKILYNDKNEIGYANAESVLEEIFPLLKESKDERIRKEIINYFAKGKEYLSLCSIGKDDILAWLEKQKPVQNINKEDEEVRQYIVRIMEQRDINVSIVQKALTWLEKQGEKKPAWSEEDESNLNLAIYYIRREPYRENDVEPIVDWLKSLKQRIGG